MTPFPARLGPAVRASVNALRRSPLVLRVWAWERPALFPGLRRRISLETVAAQSSPSVEDARQAQFAAWHPNDLAPRLEQHSAGLQVVSREFFAQQDAGADRELLTERMQAIMQVMTLGERLLVYAPHSFAFPAGTAFQWIPCWQELHGLARSAGLRVADFNPGFDRNGFFHLLAERVPEPPQTLALSGRAEYFYLEVGGDPALGNSAAVLSAAGLRALRGVAHTVSEHSFYARVPEDVSVQPGDIALGHYGRWVTGARRAGALTILYGPGDRFRPTRDDAPFYADIQTHGLFADQYAAAGLVIMQAGGRWRMTDPFPHSGLCRWMDLPVSPAVFPRTKKQIAPPGRRVFCFIGLYDDHQKGLDIARELCRRCPDFQFIAIGCKPLGMPNCREYAAVDNRRPEFRRLAAQADFIVSPARDDAQPGTVAECGSLGLLPIISETTGYVLSFPRRMNTQDLEQCAAVLRGAQAADAAAAAAWQVLNAQYLEEFHRPAGCGALMRFYLHEAMAEQARQHDQGTGGNN